MPKGDRTPHGARPDADARLPSHELRQLVEFYSQRKLIETEAEARRLLELYPDSVVIMDVLAAALVDQQRYTEAEACCRKALQTAPDYFHAHVNLGLAQKKLGDVEKSVASFRRAIELNPDFAAAHYNLGSALWQLGRNEEAIACYQTAVKVKPDFGECHASLGSIYERRNDPIKAKAHTKTALDIIPDDPVANLTWAILLRRDGNLDEALATLEPFARKQISLDQSVRIHNELGVLYDLKERPERAYGHFFKANALHASDPASKAFKKEAFLAELEQMKQIVVSGMLPAQATGKPGLKGRLPAFLVGFPRSGTTLLDQMLDSHPGIQVMEEKPVLHDLTLYLEHEFGPYPAAIASLNASALDVLRAFYFESAARYIDRNPGMLLVDKFPLNIRHMPLIKTLFPDAKIILALRHPCDVVLSNFMQHYAINHAMANFFTLSDTAYCYARVMDLWLECTRRLPIDFHTVKYEQLTSDLEGEARRLIRFLELQWHDAVLDYRTYAKKRGLIHTPSYQAVIEPINQRARYRWKRYAGQLRPLLSELQPFIDCFGYSTSEDRGNA